MACWLYQMDAKVWSPERYRAEVWEGGTTTNWKVGKIKPTGAKPQPGDTIILYYVKAHTTDPGIYGWGVVEWCDGNDIHFRPASPSDFQKMKPVWNDEISDIVDRIRGGMKMGTMWEIDFNTLVELRRKISQLVYGGK